MSVSPQEKIFDEIKNAPDLTKVNIPQGKEYIQYNNYRIHIRSYWPRDNNGNIRTPKAVVLYVHGYSSHANRPPHKYLGSFFPSNDIAYITYDNYGHGYSTGTRTLVLPPEDLSNLTLKIVNLCYNGVATAEEHCFDSPKDTIPTSTPLFLVGQSMGGAIALLTGLKLRQVNINFQGCIFLCPALIVSQPPSPVLRFTLDYILAPFFSETIMPPSLSTFKDPHDTWVNDDYIKYLKVDDDPTNPNGLGDQGMRFGSAANLLYLCEQASKAFPFIQYPFLVLHDPEDKIVSFAGSQQLVAEAQTLAEAKKLIAIPQGAHDLTANKLGEVAEHILQWVQERMGH